MKNWYQIKSPSLDDNNDVIEKAMNTLEKLVLKGTAIEGVAIFAYPAFSKKEHVVYFTPPSALIALSMGASPCEEPDTDELTRVAGDRNWANFLR